MKKQNLEQKAEKCVFNERCAIECGNSLACIGEASHLQCMVYRHYIRTDPKHLKEDVRRKLYR